MDKKRISIYSMGILLLSSLSLFCATAISYDGVNYETEIVGIESGGTLLKGLLFVPEGAIEAPAVIVLHGFANTKESHCDMDYTTGYVFSGGQFDTAQHLCSNGFVVLLYDQRGHGETGGEIDLELMVNDVKNAAEFLQNRPEVDENRIGLLGSSLGAMIACIASGTDDEIKATALWSTPASIEILTGSMMGKIAAPMAPLIENIILPSINVIIRGLLLLPIDNIDSALAAINSILRFELVIRSFVGFKISPDGLRILIGSCESSIPSFLNMISEMISGDIEAMDYVGEIAPRPLLIVHGKKDILVHPENARALYEKAGESATLVMVDETNHTFTSPMDKQDDVIEFTTKWFLENL